MGKFWAEVGSSAIEFVFMTAVMGAAIFLGSRLRIHKNMKEGK